MKKTVIALFTIAILVSMIPATGMALEPYSQDFESMNVADTAALSSDGWLVFANVFGPDWSYWYGYGVFPAPNDGGGFSGVVTGEGGGAQGAQQMVVFSDYNNADHANNAYIESNVFQEMVIGAGDIGENWVFEFDAKMGNLAGGSTAIAFIKTLNPAAGYATTNFLTIDMTATSADWTHYVLPILIDPSVNGQLLQIGFSNTATLYESSGVFYDNVEFAITGPVATENESWGGVKALYR